MESVPGFPTLLLRLAGVAALSCLAACTTVKVKTDAEAVTRHAMKTVNLLHSSGGLMADFAKGGRDLLREARTLERRTPDDASARYLKAAVDAHRLLVSGGAAAGSTEEKRLVDLHNNSLTRFVEIWMRDPDLSGRRRRISCGDETFDIRLARDTGHEPSFFDRAVPALVMKPTGIARRTREGLGAALVCVREHRPERASEMKFHPPKGIHVPATLTIDQISPAVDGVVSIDLSLRDPLREKTVVAGGRTFPLAADYSAPFAMIFDDQSEIAIGLEGFFEASKRSSTAGIYLTEPYDPRRIPVLLIHGLLSSPIIWRDLVPQLISEPDLSERYQFLVFAYPSGYPVVESATLLRNCLAEMRAIYDPEGDDPLSRDLVVAGHSMGGILAHTLVVEMGDHLWRQLNPTTPIERLDLDPDEKEALRRAFSPEPDPAVWRAIYFSAPHRGSNMAQKDIARLLSKKASLPAEFVSTTKMLTDQRILSNPQFLRMTKGTYTSAQSLRPDSPVAAALDLAPYRQGVKYHSIIGDRGKGDTPKSSDGVVEYWSSHQAGAASELIVPTGHSSYNHPLAVAEVKRILREHAGLRQ